MKKVSLCTVCMNRLDHLRQTLPRNLADAVDFVDAEFVVLDYGCRQGTARWLLDNLGDEVRSGRLVVYRAEATYYKPSHPNNVAMKLARGEVLCNVDADNFTGPGFLDWLREAVVPGVVASAPLGTPSLGGRVALHRVDFLSVGGYDEDMIGWGVDDANLVERAKLSGHKHVEIPARFLSCIEHGEDERIGSMPPGLGDRETRHRINMAIHRGKLTEGHYVANRGRDWGVASIRRVMIHGRNPE